MESGLDQLVVRSGATRSELARRAGVPRSTLYRALEGTVDVRLGTLRELALAAGFRLDISYEPSSDPDAADAARLLLGDIDTAEELVGGPSPEIAAWTERLRRYTGDGGPQELVAEAGRASSLLWRAGAIGMRGNFSADRLASCGTATGEPWALSGIGALEASGRDLEAGTGAGAGHRGVHVLWVADPRRAAQLLADTGREMAGVPGEASGADLLLCRPSQLTLHGSVNVEGIQLVSPVQGMIDCMGLGAYERELAWAVMEEW